MHAPRDIKALLARHKFIVMWLRKENAQERQNYLATGGGPRTANKEKCPFEITGPMLELANVLGVSITGLDGFGSDVPSLLTDSTTSKASAATNDESMGATSVDSMYTFDDTIQENWEALIVETTDNAESLASANETQTHAHVDETQAASPHTETVAMRPNDASFRSPFPHRLNDVRQNEWCRRPLCVHHPKDAPATCWIRVRHT